MRQISRGREADIFAWETGDVLKLSRNPDPTGLLLERLVMSAVHAQGGPAPRIGEIIEVDGRPGLLMERIDGVDLLTEVGRAPWRVRSIASLMGRAHAAIHELHAPSGLETFKDRLRGRIEGSALVPAPLRRSGVAALADLPDGDLLCHGDFHPANVMRGATAPVVIDWAGAGTGDASADVAQTVMTISIGQPPPGSSRNLRLLQKAGARLLIALYLAEYRKHRPIDDDLVKRWMLPLRVARLSHGIEEERSTLLRLSDGG